MTSDELKGYNKGYAAGRKRAQLDRDRRHEAARREAFRQRAFLAALPVCITVQGWSRLQNDGTRRPISDVDDRVRLAWEIADVSMDRYR